MPTFDAPGHSEDRAQPLGRPLHIGFIINNLAIGGAQYTIDRLVAELVAHGYQCTVFTFYGDEALAPSIRGSGGTVVAMNGSRKLLDRLPRLVRELRARRVDVINPHLPLASAVGRIAARMVGIPCASTLQCTHQSHAPIERLAELATIGLSRRVICVSSEVRRQIVEAAPFSLEQRLRTIYNSVDHLDVERRAEGFEQLRGELRINPRATVFCNIGRLHPQKGQSWLIESYALVQKQLPESHLLIVGEGDEAIALRNQVEYLDLTSNTTLLEQPSQAMRAIAASDVFVFPSRWEGLGIALLEAMALRKACISTDAEPMTECITDCENGMLVPLEDVEALAEVMVLLASDNDLRARLADSAMASTQRFTSSAMAKSYADVFNELVNV